jgi:hypothetical protein
MFSLKIARQFPAANHAPVFLQQNIASTLPLQYSCSQLQLRSAASPQYLPAAVFVTTQLRPVASV